MPLIVKPKVIQNGEKTKKDLNKVNPENLKLSNVITKNNGTVVIEVENSTEREKAKNLIKEKLKLKSTILEEWGQDL